MSINSIVRVVVVTLIIIVSCNSSEASVENYIQDDSLNSSNFLINDSIGSVQLVISDKAMLKLQEKRELALYDGYLSVGDDDWVKAKFIYRSDTSDAEVRLKGDYYDHWIDKNAWSFKVKLKGGGTFLGMRKFALQRSEVRSGINEWLFHQLLKSQGLISLRYDFLNVKVNEVALSPVYAVEENFDKNLIENNELREGLVFQLSNKDYWNSYGSKVGLVAPFFGARILPYQMKKVLKDEKLREEFKIVRNLITQFQLGNLTPDKVFNTQKLASFYAIIDLLGHHHACYNDNMKLYLNPVTSLIEPIGYDNQTIKPISIQGIMGEKKSIERILYLPKPSSIDRYMNRFQYKALFRGRDFYKQYIQSLNYFVREQVVDSLLLSMKPAIQKREELLRSSNPKYSFKGGQVVLDNVAYIRDSVLSFHSGDIQGEIVGSKDGVTTIRLLNTKTLAIEINSLIVGIDTVYLDSDVVLQPFMNKNQYAQLEFKYKGKVPAQINVNMNLFGLESIRATESIKMDANNDWKCKNSLSIVPNHEIDHSNFNKEVSDEELKKRIEKLEQTAYVDNSTVSGIKVFFKKYSEKDNAITLTVVNTTSKILEVIDVRYNNRKIFKPVEKYYIAGSRPVKFPRNKELTFEVPSLRKDYPKKVEMNFPWDENMIKGLQFNFRYPGAINNKSEEVFPWNFYEGNFFDSNIVRQDANFREFDFVQVKEEKKEIWIKEGNWTIDSGIKIPEGYTVFCHGNVVLNFINNSFLFSYSSLNFKGTKDHPVQIVSSDKTGNGIVVLNAKKRSLFNYVNFSNNGALNQFGINLTGMLTFYESDVELTNCELFDNYSEDMLNIIRSDYNIKNLYFHNVYSDALDADFSTGKIEHVKFDNIGNDAIDISGKSLQMFDVSISNSGDKGISAGERTFIKGDKISVENSEIGLSVKDFSKVDIVSLELKSNRLNLAVFQKKSEFGPAWLNVKELNERGNYLLEKRSSIVINDERLKENSENVNELLYGKVYGKSSH